MKTLFQIIALNLVIFAFLHFAHFRLLHPKIVFLAGVVDAAISVLIASVISSFVFENIVLIVAAGMFCFSSSMLYVTLLPTMVDRSITVYTLLSLRDAGPKGMSEAEISEKLSGNRIIEKRFEELQETGAILNNNGQLTLSPRGSMSAAVFALDMKLLSLDREYKIFQNEGVQKPSN